MTRIDGKTSGSSFVILWRIRSISTFARRVFPSPFLLPTILFSTSFVLFFWNLEISTVPFYEALQYTLIGTSEASWYFTVRHSISRLHGHSGRARNRLSENRNLSRERSNERKESSFLEPPPFPLLTSLNRSIAGLTVDLSIDRRIEIIKLLARWICIYTPSMAIER